MGWELENKFVMNKEIKTHKDLDVWRNSITLVTKIYEITGKFPKEEIYGIVNQMRRSAVSIPSNIAEGAGRNHKKEFIQFIYIALGSLSELETQLIIAQNLKYFDDSKTFEELIIIRRQLLSLIKSLKLITHNS
jgi:four helix bundle protein